MLSSCEQPLWDAYDVALLDLDGVVYIGPDAVPGAPGHLEAAAAAGMRLAYVTNNAARTPADVARHLRELGVRADAGDVVTSAQAAARLLADDLEPGSAVYVIGGRGLVEALAERDLRPVQSPDDDPVAVVSGYHRDITWGTVVDGAILVRAGLPWVASNTDMSVPTARGHGPGNGVLVDAVARFSGRRPVVAGKPRPPLFEETVRRVGGDRPLVVGDRLDTDIEGARAAGYDSLLVLTGVTDLEVLVAAEEPLRPTYLSTDLAGLGEPHPAPGRDGAGWVCGGWTATVGSGVLVVTGEGAVDDWWRAVAAAGWEHLDTTGGSADVTGLTVPSSVGARREGAGGRGRSRA